MPEEKPFDATPAKVRRARREGDVPRSQELGTVVVFAASGLAAFAVAPSIGAVVRSWIIAAPTGRAPVAGDALTLAGLVAGVFVVAAIAGVLINIVQSGGPVFAAPKIKPERMKPSEGLKKMFSKDAAISAARASLAFTIASLAFGPVFSDVFARASSGASLDVYASLALGGAMRIGVTALGVAAAFSVIDVLLSRQQWRKRLKMDMTELRQDLKDSEGNPHMKGRRKQIARSLARGAMSSVKQAAFVVANPTHVAVAIQYDPEAVPVPRVLVAAADEAARRVKALATRYGITIVEDVSLARLLYATAEAGESIPREAFVAVAQIVVALGRRDVRTA